MGELINQKLLRGGRWTKLGNGFVIAITILLLSHRSVKGCTWLENIMPDINGGIASVLSNTQDDCCAYCVKNFTDTLAAYYMNSQCTCLNVNHKRIVSYGSYYTYITRNPLSINQSSYECGSFGSFTLFTLYFVVSPLESYLFQVINMNLTSNLSTSVIMIKPDATYINYDGAAVGFTYQASINSQNYFVNVTSTFKVGYVNNTTQFAMSFARLADSLSKLVIYLKPFKVLANVKNSNAGFNSTLFEATNGALKLRFFIKNDYFNSSGDAEDVVFIIYYNEKIISYKSYMHTVGGMVANVTFQLLTLPPNMIKIIIPRLRCGAYIQIIVYFLSLMNNRQPVESFFLELSATIYQNGTLLQLINKNITLLADVETQNRARNRRIIGDMLSLLQFNDLLLVCEWAIDRTRNYCGILSLEGAPTFTRFSVVFLEPICYDNMTQNIYFEDKFENIVVYNYLNPVPIRLSETKEKILQLPSITLPLTISKASRVFGCNVKTQIGSYKETPYYMNSFGFIFNSSSIYNWVSPAIYTSTSFC